MEDNPRISKLRNLIFGKSSDPQGGTENDQGGSCGPSQAGVQIETCGYKTYEKGLLQQPHIEGKRRHDFTKRLGKHFLYYEINRLAR